MNGKCGESHVTNNLHNDSRALVPGHDDDEKNTNAVLVLGVRAITADHHFLVCFRERGCCRDQTEQSFDSTHGRHHLPRMTCNEVGH
jgi:hypothetical protein